MDIDTIVMIVIGVVVLFLIARLIKRGWFWTDKQGNHLTIKQFTSRYKDGVVSISPLQQTTTTLWAFLPMFAGIIWGIVVTLIRGMFWMSLILGGSLPITSVQFISNFQKYRAQKAASDMMRELEDKTKKKGRKK